MPQWDYNLKWISGRASGENERQRQEWVDGALANALIELGHNGWEVVNVFQGLDQPMNQGWYIVAKRPK